MRSSSGSETPSPHQVDEQDFSALYQQEHEAQVRRAYLILGDGGVAHDVVAEAFLVVLQRWADLDNPGAYLQRCVINNCYDFYRRQERNQQVTALLTTAVEISPDPVDHLAEVLLELPFRQRVAIVLRFYGDHSEKEIASNLGCRPGTVGSLIHRGLAALREVLDPARDLGEPTHQPDGRPSQHDPPTQHDRLAQHDPPTQHDRPNQDQGDRV